MVYTATLYSVTHIHRQYLPSSVYKCRAVCECTTRDCHMKVVPKYIDPSYSHDKYARRKDYYRT